jgi:hypothetical protein
MIKFPDESAINKATQNLIRGIKSNDDGEVMHILDEIGREINIETTDKEGRTLLMVIYFLDLWNSWQLNMQKKTL